MTLPQTTLGLALKEGGYAAAPTPQVPENLSDFLEAREIALPELSDGQVMIEVGLSPVNPSDLFFVQGGYGQPRVQGNAAGFEGVGTVIGGKGKMAEALVGQRVAFLGTATGAWAKHAISDAAICIPLHPALEEKDAAALVVNPLTAVALIERVKETGSKACIINAAGSQLGRLMLGLARDEGLAAIAVIRRAGAEDELRELGATEVLISSDAGFKAAAGAAIKTHKPRVLLDAVGDQATADLFFAMPTRSRWVSYGKMSDDMPALSQMGQFIFMDKHIEGFWLSRWLPAAAPERQMAVIKQVQERFISGKWSTRVGAELSLEEAIDGVIPAYNASTGKVMIRP